MLLCRRIALLTLFSLPTLLLSAVPNLTSPARAANGWSFTSLATTNVSGLEGFGVAAVNDQGQIVISGTRNGKNEIFLPNGSPVISIGANLPDNLGIVTEIDIFSMAIDSRGRVLFFAKASGGTSSSTAFHLFRWDNGVISLLAQNTDVNGQLISSLNNRDEWIVQRNEGTTSNHIATLSITNGITTTAFTSYQELSANCDGDRRSVFGLNDKREVLIVHYLIDKNFADGSNDSCDIANRTDKWSLDLFGTSGITRTLASGTLVLTNNSFNGNITGQINGIVQNNTGQVLYVKDIYTNVFVTEDPSRQELILLTRNGTQVQSQVLMSIDNNAIKVGAIQPLSLTDNGQIAFSATTNDEKRAIFGGANLANDLVIKIGAQLFGQELISLTPYAVNSPDTTFGDTRAFVFKYQLADGTEGVAVATRQIARWTNATGGAWETAANWLPAEVPAQNTATLFDLEASYDVTVGNRSAGRMSVANGLIGFRPGNLTLTGPLDVGNDADLVIPTGEMTAGEIIVGSLPPITLNQPPRSRLTISNSAKVTSSGPLHVGVAGEGELVLSTAATLTNGEVRIGELSTGQAEVHDRDTQWTTGSIAVGMNFTGTLNIEKGALVNSTNATIGLDLPKGTSLDDASAPDNVAVNSVDGDTPARWDISAALRVGQRGFGALTISDGGNVSADTLQISTEPDSLGSVGVFGINASTQRPSMLQVQHDVQVGLKDHSGAFLAFYDGAQADIRGNVSIGDQASDSRAHLFVLGIDTTTHTRSTFDAGAGGSGLGQTCFIGKAGKGRAEVNGGALLRCDQIRVGAQDGSEGQITVEGNNAGFVSTAQARKFFCIGGSSICETSVNGAKGIVVLHGGHLEAGGALIVGRGGSLLGDGSIKGGILTDDGVFVEDGGFINPGLGVCSNQTPQFCLPPLAPLAVQALKLPGTLVIDSKLTIRPGGRVEMDIASKTRYSRIVVTGTVTLSGSLQLNFIDGYAPKQGDTFSFIDATGTTQGKFGTVTITGLAPGFDFRVDQAGGETTLTALNNGVATTTVPLRTYLPLVRVWK